MLPWSLFIAVYLLGAADYYQASREDNPLLKNDYSQAPRWSRLLLGAIWPLVSAWRLYRK